MSDVLAGCYLREKLGNALSPLKDPRLHFFFLFAPAALLSLCCISDSLLHSLSLPCLAIYLLSNRLRYTAATSLRSLINKAITPWCSIIDTKATSLRQRVYRKLSSALTVGHIELCPNNCSQACDSFSFFFLYLNASICPLPILSFSVLVLPVPPLSLSDLQRFPEPGARHHGPAGAAGQDDPEGKNKAEVHRSRFYREASHIKRNAGCAKYCQPRQGKT